MTPIEIKNGLKEISENSRSKGELARVAIEYIEMLEETIRCDCHIMHGLETKREPFKDENFEYRKGVDTPLFQERHIAKLSSCNLVKKLGNPIIRDGKCEGFCKSNYDDEPCEQCKECRFNIFYESENQ